MFEKGIITKEPDISSKLELLKKHIEGEIQYRGEINAIKYMRKFYPYYISSVPNASKLRSKLVLLNTSDEVSKVLNDMVCLYASL